MTQTIDTAEAELVVPEGHVRVVIDGQDVIVPQGELVIRAAERIGIAIPRFCDHPLLEPVGACRQCLVEIPDAGNGRPMPKPQAACTQAVANNMVVATQHTSAVAEKAQRANLEFLLLNHPLDCPVCDKGGECPLQNQTISDGAAQSRFIEAKRVFEKPIAISTEILLDRERCVLCQRCTRFSDQIAGDEFIALQERGNNQQIGIGPDTPFQSYFSGNTIQICPVGALTSAAYRFRSRPFDLVSTPMVCEHCAGGCSLRVDHRKGQVLRRMAGHNPEVNEEWNCDKGRFAFTYLTEPDRLGRPLLGTGDQQTEASWTDAMRAAAEGLLAARKERGVGVLLGGKLSATDYYAYCKFARIALGTNDIDYRARTHSAEEADFLAAKVVGSTPESNISYTDLEKVDTVLLVALEPEEEASGLFLRLRKAARKHRTSVLSVAPLASRGLAKMFGTLIPAAPGHEVAAVTALTGDVRLGGDAVILVGERAAAVPGLLSAVAALAETSGARLAWVPRRSGERGALEVGALPTMLPGGRMIADSAAREEIEKAWGASVPATPGRDFTAIVEAAAAGELSGLVVAGVDVRDCPDPDLLRAAVQACDFVVVLEIRANELTKAADVVFPVAAATERPATLVNWEGRVQRNGAALPRTGIMDDGRVLDTLGVEMDVDLYTQTPDAVTAELRRLGFASNPRPPAPQVAAQAPAAGDGLALATWRLMLDGGVMCDGEVHLAGTAKPVTAAISQATAAKLGLTDAQQVRITGSAGSVSAPLQINAEMVDDVVWLPSRISGSQCELLLGRSTRVSVSAEGSGQL